MGKSKRTTKKKRTGRRGKKSRSRAGEAKRPKSIKTSKSSKAPRTPRPKVTNPEQYCTILSRLANMGGHFALFAQHLLTNCLDGLVTQSIRDKNSVSVFVPPASDVKAIGSSKDAKELLRAHIIRKGYSQTELAEVAGSSWPYVASNNGIKYKVAGSGSSVTVDGVKVTQQKVIVAKGYIYALDHKFKSTRKDNPSPKQAGGAKTERVIRQLAGPTLRTHIVEAYKRYAPGVLGDPYGPYSYLTSNLLMYMAEQKPSFFTTHKPWVNLYQPRTTTEYLLQHRTQRAGGRYLISDSILQGFAKSPYYLFCDPQVIVAAKNFSRHGGLSMFGGGGRHFYNPMDGIYGDSTAQYTLRNYYSSKGADVFGKYHRTGNHVEGLYKQVYKPFYTKYQTLSPETVLLARKYDDDIAKVRLVQDLQAFATETLGKKTNYEELQAKMWGSTIDKVYDSLSTVHQKFKDGDYSKPELKTSELEDFVKSAFFLSTALMDESDFSMGTQRKVAEWKNNFAELNYTDDAGNPIDAHAAITNNANAYLRTALYAGGKKSKTNRTGVVKGVKHTEDSASKHKKDYEDAHDKLAQKALKVQNEARYTFGNMNEQAGSDRITAKKLAIMTLR